MLTRRQIISTVLILGCAFSAAWYSTSSMPPEATQTASKIARIGSERASALELPLNQPTSNAVDVPPKEPKPRDSYLVVPNLYSTFQLAQSSTDIKTIQKGLEAWRTCAGIVGHEAWDLETWLNQVLPTGLPIDETEKRAKRARASAQKCAGFAGQIQTKNSADLLIQKAKDGGSTSEILRSALLSAQTFTATGKGEISRLSCDVIKTFPENSGGIRYIASAMRSAAASRANHPINALRNPAKDVAISLAFCDLDPEGCGADSSLLTNICISSGQCDFNTEEEYYRATIGPENYQSAQALRQILVRGVQQHDCSLVVE